MTLASADHPDRLLSIDEVSELLQLPVHTIYKQRSLGLFCPAYKIGRHLRWKRDELFTWLETEERRRVTGYAAAEHPPTSTSLEAPTATSSS
jgi:excisionase family DNA binding protein